MQTNLALSDVKPNLARFCAVVVACTCGTQAFAMTVSCCRRWHQVWYWTCSRGLLQAMLIDFPLYMVCLRPRHFKRSLRSPIPSPSSQKHSAAAVPCACETRTLAMTLHHSISHPFSGKCRHGFPPTCSNQSVWVFACGRAHRHSTGGASCPTTRDAPVSNRDLSCAAFALYAHDASCSASLRPSPELLNQAASFLVTFGLSETRHV